MSGSGVLSKPTSGEAPSALGTRVLMGAASSGFGEASAASVLQRRLLDTSLLPAAADEWVWNRTFSGLLAVDGIPPREFPSLKAEKEGLHAGIMQILLRQNPSYVPLPHLDEVIVEILRVARVLHGPPGKMGCAGNGLLVLGPKGIGKSTVLQAIAAPGVLHAMLVMCGELGKVHLRADPSVKDTLVLMYDIRNHSSSTAADDSFASWLLRSLRATPALSKQKQIQDLSENAGTDAEEGMVVTVNAALRSCKFRVLVVVKEAENLFSDSHFTQACADTWKRQMMLISGLDKPAIGVVLSSSMQRAQQLFLKPNHTEHSFSAYKHAKKLAANWNSRKFRPIFVSPPAWTAVSLAWFLLDQTLQRTNGSQAESVAAAEALDAAFRAAPSINYVPEHGNVPHLRAFVRLYGDVPSDLTGALQSGRIWSYRPRSSEIKEHSQKDGTQTVLSYMFELLARQGRCADVSSVLAPAAVLTINDLNPDLLVGFGAGSLRLERSYLVNGISKRIEVGPHTDAPACASCMVDAAVDNGILQELLVLECGSTEPTVSVQLRSPQQLWQAYARFVHPDVLDWFTYPGYGEHLELPMARALARFVTPRRGDSSGAAVTPSSTESVAALFSDADSSVWSSLSESSTSPSVLLHCSAARGVIVSNDDSEVGSMLTLPLVILCSNGRLVSEKSVDIETVTAVFSQPCAGGQKAWEHAQSEADGLQQAATTAKGSSFVPAIAAYLSVHRRPPGLQDYLKLERGPFWVKGFPDAAGGDLLGFFPGPNPSTAGCARAVHVLRVQVKMGTQNTLEQGRGCTASNAAADACLKKFSRKKDVKASTREAITTQCGASARALAGSLAAAALGPRPAGVPLAKHFPKWASRFDQLRTLFNVTVTFVLATTHALSATKRAQLESRGVCVVEAEDLRHSWGALGVLGAQHGVLPFAAGPAADTAAAAVDGNITEWEARLSAFTDLEWE
mgnify:CR=1 FL=1